MVESVLRVRREYRTGFPQVNHSWPLTPIELMIHPCNCTTPIFRFRGRWIEGVGFILGRST
jgi:hypothetical protein